MDWPILTRRVLAVPIKGAAAVSCARLLLAGFCSYVPVPWAVTLSLCGALGMVLTHFVDHLNRMGGMDIDGYTLGQYCDRLVLLVLAATDARFPFLCSYVPVPWAVTLGLCGALGMVLTHFIDHLNRMGGMNIDGYTLGQYCDRVVLLLLLSKMDISYTHHNSDYIRRYPGSQVCNSYIIRRRHNKQKGRSRINHERASLCGPHSDIAPCVWI